MRVVERRDGVWRVLCWILFRKVLLLLRYDAVNINIICYEVFMESLMELWVEEDLYQLIDDYLVAIGRGLDSARFNTIVRNFEEYWDYEACNKMIAHMINTVYDIDED